MLRVGYSVLSGVLLGISWPYSGSLTPLIFIAWIPLFLLEDSFSNQRSRGKLSLYVYLTFLVFNTWTTWWIYAVAESFTTKIMAAAPAILLNGLFMAIAYIIYFSITERIGGKYRFFVLGVTWIAWEFLHLNWELSWPWLTLGNAFSIRTSWIQWYEFTGILGGSIWILAANAAIYLAYEAWVKSRSTRSVIRPILILILPGVFSLILHMQTFKSDTSVRVVVVQPNIDPYNDKFNPALQADQLRNMLNLAKPYIQDQPTLVLFPETALQERTSLALNGDQIVYSGLWENAIEHSISVHTLRNYLDTLPYLSLIFGMSSDRMQQPSEPITPASRYIPSLQRHYQSYNAAMLISKGKEVEFYHKSELVPAVEFMPLERYLKMLGSISLDLGGTTGTLGTQENQTPFITHLDSIAVSPAICYESIYGHSAAEFTRNGAGILGVITNDGWWSNTPGYKQHLSYARLRAIENRRWIARSANTGISAFIDPYGRIVQESTWWVEDALAQEVPVLREQTFYTTYADFIGRFAVILFGMLTLYSFIFRFIRRSRPG